MAPFQRFGDSERSTPFGIGFCDIQRAMPHLKDLSGVRRVYLIGICGTAMASLAGMLRQRGYEVAGSMNASHLTQRQSVGYRR
jgi:hypothetical protein